MLIRFRWFGLRKSRKPSHMPSHWTNPDEMDPTRRIPTIHATRYEQQLHQAEQVNLSLRRYYRYHAPTSQDRDELGSEVAEAMLIPEEPHEALTEMQTRPTRIIRNPFDPNKTQPLEQEE